MKNTTAFTCNLIETVLGKSEGQGRKTQILSNLKAIDTRESPPNDKVICFPTDQCKLQKSSDSLKIRSLVREPISKVANPKIRKIYS